jgi:hypothetical protein
MSAQLAYAPTLWHEMFATVFNDHHPSTGAQRAARLLKKRPYLASRCIGTAAVRLEARADELIE